MTKFFDSSERKPAENDEESTKPEVRNVVDRDSLEIANKALRDAGFETEFSGSGDAPVDQGIVPIRYTKEIIGDWQIDHGAKGWDYMIQLIPRREVRASAQDVVAAIIHVMRPLVPDDVQVHIQPPNPGLEINFYTIRLEKVLRKPGAESVVKQRIPAELGKIKYAS